MAAISKVSMQVQLQFMVFLLFISMGSCLQCYKCYSTNKQCKNGNPEYLDISNCTKNEVCATFQYEMEDSSVSYITTIRGCQPIVKDGICSQLMKIKSTKKAVQRGIMCNTCNTTLCNSAAVRTGLSLTVIISIVTVLIIRKT